MARRMTAPAFRAQKGKKKLVCLTAYDTDTARILDAAGVDLILIGDSMGNVHLGYENTLPVTMDDLVSHAAAVVRARPRALVVADMPYLSFHVSPEETVRNAGRLVKEAGVDAVKLEGAHIRIPHIQAVLAAKIPVMGHIGLTPQSVLEFGGYRIQGRDREAVDVLTGAARALAEAGCFAIVIEGVPGAVGEALTRAVDVPTIGIGAGAGCDGQVLVTEDMLGWTEDPPAFVRRYAELRRDAADAVLRFVEDVRGSNFPGSDETYPE